MFLSENTENLFFVLLFKWMNKLQILVTSAFLERVPTFMEMGFVVSHSKN